MRNKIIRVVAFMALVGIAFLVFSNNSSNRDIAPEVENSEKIETIVIRIDDRSYKVKMDTNAAAQEFAISTPFELTMSEHGEGAKYYRGEDKLKPSGSFINEAKCGDLMLANDDTIILFYKDQEVKETYTRLGWVQGADDLATMLGEDSVVISFTKS